MLPCRGVDLEDSRGATRYRCPPLPDGWSGQPKSPGLGRVVGMVDLDRVAALVAVVAVMSVSLHKYQPDFARIVSAELARLGERRGRSTTSPPLNTCARRGCSSHADVFSLRSAIGRSTINRRTPVGQTDREDDRSFMCRRRNTPG